MEKRSSIFLTLIFTAALFIFCACTARAQGPSGQEQPRQETPSQEMERVFNDAGLRLLNRPMAPREFSLQLVGTESVNLRLSELRGKVVFLNFWATWCPPCRDEMPSMESLYRRYKDEGLEIVAVNLRESHEQVLAFMNEYELTFPAVLDLDGRIGGAYGVQAIPTSFLINREGQIVARLVGFKDWDTPQIHAAFETLLR